MRIFKTSSFTTQMMILLFAVSFTSCVGVHTHNSSVKTKKVPPGQAKKMSGAQSAKNYAPGHNK